MNKVLVFVALMSLFACTKAKDSVSIPIITNTDTAQFGIPYTNIPSTTDIVLYEINERAYSASGNFAGITQRLDSIKALGVNTIWLMPINPIGLINTVNSPYCVRDFRSLNSEFGTMTDLRNLVIAAHSKNMAVMLDWAANQTSWDNSWITAHKNWYRQDANGNIVTPNSIFLDVAQLDFTNMEMRSEMIACMKYWVHTANIDGYRCDFADNVPDDFWQQAIDSLNNITPSRKLILLAEGYNVGHLNAGFQMNFGSGFYDGLVQVFSTSSPQPATLLYTKNTEEYTGVIAGKQRLRFTTNHDYSAFNGTPMVVFGGKQGSLAALVATFYMGGVPLIYGSQEVGTTNSVSFFNNSTPINWNVNPDMVQEYKKIIALRSASAPLKTGTLTTYPDNDIVCYKRTIGSSSFVILVNVRNANKTFSVPSNLQGTWTNAFDSTKSVVLGSTQSINAYQYLVLKK